MSERSVTPPITGEQAARVTPGPGTVVHRKPLTVVVSTDGDVDRTARGITAVVEALVEAGDLAFGPVAAGLQQFVVDHQPTGVAAVLDVAPDAIAFLFDSAVSIGTATTHRASGRSGWTTVFIEGESVSLVVGPGPERPVDPWSRLWAGTVGGQGVQVDLDRSYDPTAIDPVVERRSDDLLDVSFYEADPEPVIGGPPIVEGPTVDELVVDEVPAVDQLTVDNVPAVDELTVDNVPAGGGLTDAFQTLTIDDATPDDLARPGGEPAEADTGADPNVDGNGAIDGGSEDEDEPAAVAEPADETSGGEAGPGPVIELDADPIDLSSSAMPSWNWPPPQPEPAGSMRAEAPADTTTARGSDPGPSSGRIPSAIAPDADADVDASAVDPPPDRHASAPVEPISGPPPMPTGFPAPAPQAEPIAGAPPMPTDPPPPQAEPISGPPPMPTELPPPPPGAMPIAGPPPMPDGAERSVEEDEPG